MRNTSTDKRQMYVLPSQLNAAEHIDKHRIPNHDPQFADWKAMYRGDSTGGPRGQLAGDHAIAEYIVENSETEVNKDPNSINYVREILNDTELNKKLSLINGYLGVTGVWSDDELAKLRGMMGNIKLLVSKDLPVSGYDVSLKQAKYQGKKVNLAYASAVPLGIYGNDSSESTRRVANIIMEAQYTAALKAALDLGIQELFLLPVGGGVFKNRRRDIVENIIKALKKVDMTGIDVKLLTYGPASQETIEFRSILGQ